MGIWDKEKSDKAPGTVTPKKMNTLRFKRYHEVIIKDSTGGATSGILYEIARSRVH